MEKLIDLLNEMEREKSIERGGDGINRYYGWDYNGEKIRNRDYDPDAHQFMVDYVIGKRCWFIEWLVKKGFIDWGKVHDKEIESWYDIARVDYRSMSLMQERTDRLLMVLSIQENPIKVLISLFDNGKIDEIKETFQEVE